MVTNNTSSEETSVAVTEQVEEKKDFSYLQDLSDEKQKAYEQFAQSKNLSLLEDFKPEEILLIYLHSCDMLDTETVYTLTYNNSAFSTFEMFQEEYNTYLLSVMQQMVIDYRFYNSISANDPYIKPIKPLEADQSFVVINGSYGLNSYSTIMMLKKEGGIWKVDSYDLIQHLKETN